MNVIIIYSYLIIFGGWILKLMGVHPDVGLPALQALDYIPLTVFLFSLNLKSDKKFFPTSLRFWLVILALVLLGLVVTAIHGGRVMSAVSHLGAMLRYVPLAVIIGRMSLRDRDISKFVISFKWMYLVLLAVGFMELLNPNLNAFFAPLAKEGSTVYSNIGRTVGFELFGVFPNTIDYSYFLLIGYLLLSNAVKGVHSVLFWVVTCALIFFSGSKAAIIIMAIITAMKLYRLHYRKLFFSVVFLSVVCCSIAIYLNWDLFYWTVFVDSQASRLGIITHTLPSFLGEFSLDTLFGVGPDYTVCFEKIHSFPVVPLMLNSIDMMGSFEDEFYVAIIMYYGVIGFMLILTLFIGLAKSFKASAISNKFLDANTILDSLFTCLLISPLFNQIIITKPFSLFFWITVGIITSQIIGKNVHMSLKINN